MKNLSERIIEVLKNTKRIKTTDIQKALELYSKEEKGKLRDVLVRMGLITEKELISLLSMELEIPFLNLSKYKIKPELAQIIPEKVCRKHQLIPISKIGEKITLAMADPVNIVAIDDIMLLTNMKVECVIATEKDIEEALDRLFSNEMENITALAKAADASSGEEAELQDVVNADAGADEGPIVKIIDLLLRQAVKKRASDIHVEPQERDLRVRFRIDGQLHEEVVIPKKNQNAVLTRLKIISRMDITENRVPQDGRFKAKLANKEIDLRVSALPVYFGNKIVMRLLDKSSLNLGLETLGFLPHTLEAFRSCIAKPFGMLLITGPTGSGKSTTLYSVLSQLNTPDKNIITIEDPIEYQVKGITQIQTRPEVGLTFANGLRAIFRQSPDIVMVGEIRDSETADIAIKASLTGQLVLSTLHTNDAAGAITRLIDMKVEPFLIASSVLMVGAQRLCRRNCPSCREKVEIDATIFDKMGTPLERLEPDPTKRMFFKGKGCDKCNQTGYRGRMAILEALVVDDTIRDMIMRCVPAYEIKNYAMTKGMTTLREDAMIKFVHGETTAEEVIRVTSEDE